MLRASRRHLSTLLSGHDFALITETHSTTPDELDLHPWLLQRRLHAWWSHGTAQQAGVLILVTTSFLNKFQSSTPTPQYISQGRILALTLVGPCGTLCLTNCYFPTGHSTTDIPQSPHHAPPPTVGLGDLMGAGA